MAFASVLETERLILRRLLVEDKATIFEYASDPEVTRFMTFPNATTEDDSVDYLTASQQLMDDDLEFHWAIERKETPGLIGVVSLRRIHGLEFGWILARAHWGNGYMPEAGAALVKWGFEVDGAWRIWATCHVDNEKSAAAMRKIGMTEEGVLRRWVLLPNLGDEPSDCKVLSIIR